MFATADGEIACYGDVVVSINITIVIAFND